MTVPGIHRPLAYNLLPKKWFYGWYIAIACAVLMFVGVGVGYYGLPIFLKPLKEEHGWTTTQVSWAPAIYFCISGLTGAIIGPLIDKRGPMLFMVGGMIVNGIAGACIGLVNELWQLYLVYFIFAVAFGASSSVAVNAIMTRWFVRRRALAMSISSTGVSAGGMIVAPIAAWLIDVGGLELATPILGGLVIVAGLPVVLWVLAWTPESMGLQPDGSWATAPVHELNRPGASDARPNVRHDGLEIVFDSTRAGGPPQIYSATRSSVFDPWSRPELLDTNVNLPGFAQTRPSISRDGRRLYFGSSRDNLPGDLPGGADVFVSTRSGPGKGRQN